MLPTAMKSVHQQESTELPALVLPTHGQAAKERNGYESVLWKLFTDVERQFCQQDRISRERVITGDNSARIHEHERRGDLSFCVLAGHEMKIPVKHVNARDKREPGRPGNRRVSPIRADYFVSGERHSAEQRRIRLD
jgi:hypothetical protein